MKKALIVVDVQNDFCEGGSLEVPKSNEIFPYINGLMENETYDEIVFTQDFHPQDHKSFASNNRKKVGEIIDLNGTEQVMWPDHCVQGTFGVEFHKEIKRDKATHILKKGMYKEIDSYSAFFDNHRLIDTGLSKYLKDKGVTKVDVVGLALDYCVKFTCLDAVSEGFKTTLHLKGTKAVNLNPNDAMDTIFELKSKGVNIKK